MQTNEILRFLHDPATLESLYRSKPAEFPVWLAEAAETYPESETLRVWNARIAFGKKPPTDRTGGKLLFVVLVSMLAGVLAKLHLLIHADANWYLPRFVPLIVIGSLIGYFLNTQRQQARTVPIAGLLACVALLWLLPETKGSASVTMSLIHMPLVLLSLLAATFMGGDWRSNQARLLFVRYLGEVLIYAAVILLGGMVLTFLTFALFSLIHVSMENWYMNYVVVSGLIAAPLVATYLYDVALGRESWLATIIANIFSPLVLVTVSAYLVAIVAQGKSPYTDRDFLISINGLLLVVLAITVYSVAGKAAMGRRPLLDAVNICLVAVTLLIDVFALSAILFRWAEYGMTPNRVSVTGANLLIFGHLLLILKDYINHARRQCPPERLLDTVAAYLPLYSGWSVLMAVGLPLAFGFE